MKKVVSIFLVIIMITVLSAPGIAQAATFKISKTKATLEVDATLKLKVSGIDSKVIWSTSKKTVATVKDGTITAVKEGQATITAEVSKKSYSCIITVVNSQQDEVKAEKGTITELSTGLYIIGEDFPSGKYNVKALSGSGNFFVDSNSNDVNEILADEGNDTFDTHTYSNLRMYYGDTMEITSGVVLEFTKLD